MFRGEPLALHLILMGLIFFPITMFIGLFLPGALFTSTNIGLYPAHFVSAFLGWIGLVILGAQLQFFRAISAIRTFDPEWLRPIYFISAVIGTVSLLLGNLLIESWLIYTGMALFTIAVIIHTIYTIPQISSKLFKFPLNYFAFSHVFLVTALIMMWLRILDTPLGLADNFNIIHILSIGWISMNLQGAATRALPMFVGMVIDRDMRGKIDTHAMISFISSIILIVGLMISSSAIISIGSLVWIATWLFTFILLFRSIRNERREIEYPITLGFFVPGFIFLSLGALLGMDMSFRTSSLPRAVHIHLNLVAGLALIMLGAIHRISSFQMYTAVYTGRRESGVRIDAFLRTSTFKMVLPGLILSPLILITGFIVDQTAIIGTGAILLIIHVLIYIYFILQNYLHYRREVPNAIPYDKKKSEVDA